MNGEDDKNVEVTPNEAPAPNAPPAATPPVLDNPVDRVAVPPEGAAPTTPEPASMDEMFTALREQRKAAAAAAESGAGTPGDEAGSESPGSPGSDVPPPANPEQPEGQSQVGGYDVSAAFKQLDTSIKENVTRLVRAELQRQNIVPATLANLQRVDENTKAVEFINPDDNRPFSGSNPRKDAMEWVEAYNKNINEYAAKLSQDEYSRQIEEAQGQIEIIRFAPVYEKMDEQRKAWFEDMVAPYEILDADGNVIGYNCNLAEAAQQLERSIAFLSRQQEALEAQAKAGAAAIVESAAEPSVATPQVPGTAKPAIAIDMPSSGGTPAGANDKPPANMEEAYTYLRNKKKGQQ